MLFHGLWYDGEYSVEMFTIMAEHNKITSENNSIHCELKNF